MERNEEKSEKKVISPEHYAGMRILVAEDNELNMDIMMPGMNGLEAAHAIRMTNRKDSQTIPIIAVSANAFEEDTQSSLASGMNAHLSKSVEVEKLKETLHRVLG